MRVSKSKLQEKKREFKCGTTSTVKPRFDLIPKIGLVKAANRFEYGLITHGEKAWNNLSVNQDALTDKDWLIDRCSHAINHCYSMIDKLSGKAPLESGEDDAGAIAWCGLMLGAAVEELKKRKKSK